MQRRDTQRQSAVARQKCSEIGAGIGPQAIFGEECGQGFAAPGRFGQQQNAAGETGHKGLQGAQRVVGTTGDGNWRQGSGRAVGACAQDQPRMRPGGDKERLFAQKKIGRGQQGPAAFAGKHGVTRLRIAPETADRFGHVIVQADQRIAGQVVEQRCRFFKKQGQPVFDACRSDAVRYVFVDPGARRIAFEDFAKALAETGAALVVQWEFACRKQADFLNRVKGALGIDVEGLDVLDFVVEQVKPIRQRRTHREQIDQPAAHRVFAGRDNLGDMRVSGQRELGAELPGVESFAFLQEEGVGRQVGWGHQAVNRRRRRDQQHVAFAAHHAVERGQTFRDEIVVRRKAVIGQRFPVRQHAHAQAGRKPRYFFEQALGVASAGGQHGQQGALARHGGQLRDVQRVRRAGIGR